jgi:bacteriorhodopsin
MLSLSCWVLSATALAGVVLVLLHLRATSPGQRPHWMVGAAHGIAGATGVVLLLVALRGPPRGVATGSSSFGVEAAVLLAAALLAGLLIVVLARQRAPERTVTGAMVVHALLAVTGYVLWVAYASLE